MNACLARLGALLFAASAMLVPAAALADGEVNIYTTREPGLLQPTLDAFAAETGIRVNSIYIKEGLGERVAAEGENSPADLMIVVDYGNLIDLVERGLTQPVESEVLTDSVPASLRDPTNHWFALTMRARIIYYSKDRVSEPPKTYEELADPKWKGRICIRSGQHPYNTSLFAAFMAKHGAEATEKYLTALRDNLARKAAGGDRDGARDILAGICDVAVGNSYYVGLMRSGAGGEEHKAWGEAIDVVLPTFDDGRGTHVNISGAAVARHAPNRANAVRLLEYLVAAGTGTVGEEPNFEYPIKAGAPVQELTAALGTLTIDPLPLTEIGTLRKEVSLLVDKVGFDN